MKDSELIEKVHSAVYHQCQRRGYAAPVDMLTEIGVLSKQKYEEWRFGKIPYLEQACTCNYRQLSTVIWQICGYAKRQDCSSLIAITSGGVKKRYGHKQVIPLRFSKSGRQEIEWAYTAHYVDSKRIEQLKNEAQDGHMS